MAGPMPAVGEVAGRPREDRTDDPPTEAPDVRGGFLAGVSQGTGPGGGHA